ncbi:hypothetical protein ASPZODRAFT_137375 [Penicilliopsis zonata CBS 506.65]|uniref:Alanyl-transfer RNA synthetases family profile domain-containing protein n=1 Tax=Penicilliopsis zonata CBS 506.65 TaxID=1073090 RepID=A0A1L9S566_9EURO|nr:hypothetical protein ASPZODRAFT_137375 [Penicilliopsis zonata CBS 506.65]OJJ42291.1 hypothetical protein ASPZODRAFT_137375 [Penicilliopsis zonata CBS 506.65]
MTALIYHNSNLYSLEATVLAVFSFTEDGLFKDGTPNHHIVVTDKTIFHPQGGGQPSDEGVMKAEYAVFTVTSVRMRDDKVLHLGIFTDQRIFSAGDTIIQNIDIDKRILYSRYHTAGHVLGSAVRSLLENEIEGFDELKASHFPDSASCEFRGAIEGKYKPDIQKKVDEVIAAKLPVRIEWWDESDFISNDLQRLIPRKLSPGEKLRVVNIVGAEVYPCGGTHVETTDLCGPVAVRKIARKSGVSKVSYTVME